MSDVPLLSKSSCLSQDGSKLTYICTIQREVVAGYMKEYLCMKSGTEDNSLMFITLANLPSKPKPFPRVECAGIMLWSKC